jgi:hypothetical protein
VKTAKIHYLPKERLSNQWNERKIKQNFAFLFGKILPSFSAKISGDAFERKMVTDLFLLIATVHTFLTLETVPIATAFEVEGQSDGCDCSEVDVVSNRDVVLRKHADVLGRYTRIPEGLQSGLKTPSYVHTSGKYFLYYSAQSQVKQCTTFKILKQNLQLQRQRFSRLDRFYSIEK